MFETFKQVRAGLVFNSITELHTSLNGVHWYILGLILGLRPVNKRRRYLTT